MFQRTISIRFAVFLAAAVLFTPLLAYGDEPEEYDPVGVISEKLWKSASTAPLNSGEIDRLILAQLKKIKKTPVKVISDETFIRRATLDLTGKLPTLADIQKFITDKNPKKRAQLIDDLLASEDYSKHWALYWRDVVSSGVDDIFARLLVRSFQAWMTEQLAKNRSWADITNDMLTASGEMKFAETKNGAGYLFASRRGADAVENRASETSRIFLGIQIQCAQCHDHPTDVWKRNQFHEFAAYFARVRERLMREEKRFVGLSLVSMPFGEYVMPEDRKKGRFGRFSRNSKFVSPRFLDGDSPGARLPDLKRREALVEKITSKDNPWFAAAFVNRIWGALLGQSFYEPIDEMGPLKSAVFPTVLPRLAGAFRGSNYDIKQLFRMIMNSDTYQRDVVAGESKDSHLYFAAVYPSRVRANALWESLEGALGSMSRFGRPGGRRFGGGFGGFGRRGLEFLFVQEFNFDPSTKTNEVEGSVSQALFLMNNPLINQKIKAVGKNLLGRVLTSYQKDDEALRNVYLQVLARRPSDREMERCRKYIDEVGDRAEAYEDILWVLINSTEFQTRK